MVKSHRNRADSFRGPLAAGRQSGNYSTPGLQARGRCGVGEGLRVVEERGGVGGVGGVLGVPIGRQGVVLGGS